MAKMTRKEALSKLRLLNRDPAFVMYVNPSNTSAIYIDVDPSTLILGDTYLGNIFEWVDPDHKQLKVLGDTDADAFVIDVKPRTNMDPTITHVKIDGPNSSVLKKTNELVKGLLVPIERRIAGESYQYITGDFYILDADRPKYDALMQLSNVLEMGRVFSGGSSDNVLEMGVKINTEDGKTPFTMFINKNDIPSVLRYINVLKTFNAEIELPNELYQMDLVGVGAYNMKNMPGSTVQVPEPKKAAETSKDYNARLAAHFPPGLATDPGTGLRAAYPFEKMDYSKTVAASNTVIGTNPTSNGEALDTVAEDPNYESATYSNQRDLNGRTRVRPAYVDEGVGRRVRSEEDVNLKTRIANGLKTTGRFLKNHKGVIIGCIAVAAIAGFAIAGAGGVGALLSGIARYALLAAKQLILPIPQVLAHWFVGSQLTTQAAWIAILETVGLVALARHVIKKKLADRKRRRISQQQIDRNNMAKWRASNAELETLISQLQNSLISLDAELADPSLVGPERDAVQRARDRAAAKITDAQAKIAQNRANISALEPDDLEVGDLTFVDREELGGGIRF